MYSTLGHLAMMQDARRMGAYSRAIAETVRRGDVVLDVGCGAGALTFLALEAGASHVFAVESSESIELAKLVARKNRIANITFLKADLRDVALPGPVDVIVADVRGATPVLGNSLQVMQVARAKHLREGGRMIPVSDRIFVAPIESPEAHGSVSGWHMSFGKADYSCLSDVASNQTRFVRFSGSAVLAIPVALTPDIDYRADCPRTAGIDTVFEALRDGHCHGLAAWFEATLSESVSMSTSPEEPHTIYGQAYFPGREPQEVKTGDRLQASLRVTFVGQEPVWTWSIRGPGDSPKSETHSSLRGRVLSGDALRARAPEYVPSLNIEGDIDYEIIGLMKERRSNAEIGQLLLKSFPSHFNTADEAISRVGKLAVRYAVVG